MGIIFSFQRSISMATLDLTGDDHLERMPTSLSGNSHKDRFASKFDYRYVGLAVLYDGTTVTAYPGVPVIDVDDLNAAENIWFGGDTWTVTAGQETLLTAAGYTVT